MVSCGEDCSLTVIRLLADGSVMVSHLLQGHVSRVRCVSVDGSLLLSGSDDRSAKVWEVTSGETSESWGAIATLSGHAWPVCGVWLEGGLAVTADTNTVRLWSEAAGWALLRTISGLTNTGEVRLDLTGGSLLVASQHTNLTSFSLAPNSDSASSWQFKPHQPGASGKSQVRLSGGHSTLILISSATNCHSVNIIDFLSS